MKICPRCKKKYSNRFSDCPACNNKLASYETMLDKFYTLDKKPKTAIIGLSLTLCFILGAASMAGLKNSSSSVASDELDSLLARCDALLVEKNKLQEECDNYKAAVEKKQESEKWNAVQKAAYEESVANTDTAKSSSSYTSGSTSDSSSNNGIIPKNYKPKGNEADWLGILTACEIEARRLIGSDVSISLFEENTSVIKTGLRYKLKTDSLKIKSNKTYHKAVFILEFTDDSYEKYRLVTAELDGQNIL